MQTVNESTCTTNAFTEALQNSHHLKWLQHFQIFLSLIIIENHKLAYLQELDHLKCKTPYHIFIFKNKSQLNSQPALPIFSIYNFFICDWMTEKGLTIFSHSSLTLNEVSPIFIWHVFYSVITRNRYWCDSFNFTAQWAGEKVNRVQNIWQRNSLGHH